MDRLKKLASDFRSSLNTGTHDWYMYESDLLFETLLIVCLCREYCVGTDQNAYSLVYVFQEGKSPSRIYYDKFWDGCPEWRDPKRFLRTIKSATRNGDRVELVFETEDGATRTQVIISPPEKSKESSTENK